MAEYITKEKVIEWFRPYGHTDKGIPYFGLVTDIREMKAADVTPVVHGQWLRSDDDWGSLTSIRCSICGEEWCFEMIDDVTLLNYKYCPNCGARMDGGVDHA